MRKRPLSALPIHSRLGLVGYAGIESSSEPTPWEGPTDDTWAYGDVGFGETFERRNSDYRVTVAGLPEFGPLEDEKVIVTGTFNVERFQDRDSDDEILDNIRFGFTPGAGTRASLNEA